MPAPRDTRLLDALARHQVYLEGLKLGYTQKFVDMTERLRQDLRETFFTLEFNDLSEMSKRELEQFIRRLLLVQSAHYSSYTKELIDDLLAFMNADLEMQTKVMRETQDDKTGLLTLGALLGIKRRDKLWVTIINAPIPANGVLPDDMIKRFVATGAYNIETAVRKAWANKASVRSTQSSVVGTARTAFRDGVVNRAIPQADALIATIMQHTAGIVQMATAKPFFDKYRWASVMDNRTSEICTERNGKVYVYGAGPLPPAHWKCRSHTEPYDGGDERQYDTFEEWLKSQPENLRDELRAAPKTPLTLAEFVGKLKSLLAG